MTTKTEFIARIIRELHATSLDNWDETMNYLVGELPEAQIIDEEITIHELIAGLLLEFKECER